MGKIIEDVKLNTAVFKPQTITATGVLYNDNATGAVGIDTKDYDEATFILDAGLFSGAASVAFDIYENATNDAETSNAVTGASFTTVTAANDNAVQVGSVLTKNTKRYLFCRTNKTSNTNQATFAVKVALGKGESLPVASQTAVFDVNYQ